MKKAGADGVQTVFLFSDTQIKEEAFVEDINMILNTADIPNLFPADEKAELIEKMQVWPIAFNKLTYLRWWINELQHFLFVKISKDQNSISLEEKCFVWQTIPTAPSENKNTSSNF